MRCDTTARGLFRPLLLPPTVPRLPSGRISPTLRVDWTHGTTLGTEPRPIHPAVDCSVSTRAVDRLGGPTRQGEKGSGYALFVHDTTRMRGDSGGAFSCQQLVRVVTPFGILRFRRESRFGKRRGGGRRDDQLCRTLRRLRSVFQSARHSNLRRYAEYAL